MNLPLIAAAGLLAATTHAAVPGRHPRKLVNAAIVSLLK
jgi:hypothetical protein